MEQEIINNDINNNYVLNDIEMKAQNDNEIIIDDELSKSTNDEDDEEYNPLFPNNYEKIFFERKVVQASQNFKKKQELREQKKLKMKMGLQNKINELENIIKENNNMQINKMININNNQNDTSNNNNIMKNLFKAKEMEALTSKNQATKKDKAKSMLEKMGWKEGSGLGKYEQGIVTPLFAKKTNNKQGVIINQNIEPIDFNIKDYYRG